MAWILSAALGTKPNEKLSMIAGLMVGGERDGLLVLPVRAF